MPECLQISANYLHSRPPKKSTQLCNMRSQKHFYALRMAYLGLWYLLPSWVSPLGTLQELLVGFRSNRNQQSQKPGWTTLRETNSKFAPENWLLQDDPASFWGGEYGLISG